jgi:uncharacterized protein YyaL (SSP411 family)
MANRLIDEQSPYLLQHAHNPVDWYPWGDEPFKRAEKENKPVLVSIGYAACHWCHVMEHESFEDKTIAAFMNEHFINIKVDREEHPGVDHMYMDAVQAISGSGGWPLNVFVTPGRVPFYGGTYFPPRPAFNRPSWPQLLQRMHDIWTTQPEEISAQTGQMLQYLKQASQTAASSQGADWNKETCKLMAANLLKQADTEWGGFGRAPKFPGTMAITYLLEHHYFTTDQPALQQALLSLDKMIAGGIYDQLGGGFARYSTDEQWLAPHFEKMLYDNALLVMSMCDAYQLTGKPHYCKTIEETITFVERELKDSSGGYYSALDADSEGVEGKFYTFTGEDWKDIIGEADTLPQQYFGIEEHGNWEHTNILHVAKDVQTLSVETGMPVEEIEKRIAEAKQKLLQVRNTRIRPLTDDKSLLSWNALMNIALVKAGIALKNTTYLQRANEHMDWMLDAFQADGTLYHVWKQGKAKIAANLDDYAYLVQALLQLGSALADNSRVVKAIKLTETVLKDFKHEDGVFCYYTSASQADIPVRKVEMYDGALPSSNAVMAHNLMILGNCMERTDLLEQAYVMLRQMSGSATRYTYSFAYWAQLLQRYTQGIYTVIAAGNEAVGMLSKLQEHYLPHAYLLTSQKEISELPLLNHKFSEGQNSIFVCTAEACLSPETDVERVLQTISPK